MGVKTRNKKKASNMMIVRRRNGKQKGTNMSRSNKKGAFVDASLMKKVLAAKKDAKKKPIKT